MSQGLQVLAASSIQRLVVGPHSLSLFRGTGPPKSVRERWEEKGFLGVRRRRVPHVAFHACSSLDLAAEGSKRRPTPNSQPTGHGNGIEIVPGEWASCEYGASPRTDNCFAASGERAAREVNDTQPVETLGWISFRGIDQPLTLCRVRPSSGPSCYQARAPAPD